MKHAILVVALAACRDNGIARPDAGSFACSNLTCDPATQYSCMLP